MSLLATYNSQHALYPVPRMVSFIDSSFIYIEDTFLRFLILK